MKFLVMCYEKRKGNGKQGKAHRFKPARWVCAGSYKLESKAQDLLDMFVEHGMRHCRIIKAETAQQARQFIKAGGVK